ncbi:MAG: CDP-alcohol phosphatidyltransferase family protein [Clostridia bacterium]|nr:CDP-alcohol phosphatidyltransferase family protein [Clostridia bacterium]
MKKYLKYVPNILTLIRFLLIPIIITLLSQGKYVDAIIVFSISGITDILDGTIARKFDLITNFGKLIDPLADKFTQLSMLIMLTVKRIIPLWIVIVVFIKEFVMICGASFLYGRELVVSSKWYGKAATTLFYIAIVVSLILKELEPSILASQPAGNSAPPVILDAARPIYYIAIIMTLFSLVMYVKAFFVQGYLKKNKV